MIEIRIQDKYMFITKTVVDIFYTFRQNNQNDNEMGGIVLGQISEAGNKILVCRASIPNDTDKSEKIAFHRNKGVAQQIVEYEFYNSDRKNTYLGEWHTHPAKVASPSSQDLDMIKKQFEKNELKVEFTIMFIIAREELFAGLYNGHKMHSVIVPI